MFQLLASVWLIFCTSHFAYGLSAGGCPLISPMGGFKPASARIFLGDPVVNGVVVRLLGGDQPFLELECPHVMDVLPDIVVYDEWKRLL